MCGASFYTAETDVKNPTDFLEQSRDCSKADRVTLIIPEERRNKENEGREEISAAKGSSSSRHLQQLPAPGGPCLRAGSERLCKSGELCQVLSPDTSQTTSMAPTSEGEKQQGHA